MANAASRMLVMIAGFSLIGAPLAAQTIYPIDRAAILAGARFDFKIEFPEIEKQADLKITIDGEDYTRQLGKAGQFVENEDGLNASALVLWDASIDKPGIYKVLACDGTRRSEVTWTVFGTGPRVARNVILFIGDGMRMANRTAARILSKGIKEGKYFGKLAIDDMPHMALIGTSGVDSITTDSANSMSAYTTGHKSSVNALGVYAARNKNNFEHPKVETIAELTKRKLDLAVGVVSDAEVQDATPAGMVAHTRRRADKPEITQMFLDDRVDVLMGGGAAYFSPKSKTGSKRKDDKNYIELYQQAGFKLVTTEDALKATTAEPSTMKLLGLFHPENMDGALDPAYPARHHGRQIPAPARSRRHDAGRDRSAVTPSQWLCPDGRGGADRQIPAPARLGAQRLRYHHARQHRQARQGLRGDEQRHTDFGDPRSHSWREPRRHHRRRQS